MSVDRDGDGDGSEWLDHLEGRLMHPDLWHPANIKALAMPPPPPGASKPTVGGRSPRPDGAAVMDDDDEIIPIGELLETGLFCRESWLGPDERHAELKKAIIESSDKPRRGRAPRKSTLASVAKQASKAGIEVARYEVEPDGKINVVTGQPEPSTESNPWLGDLKVTKQ
jgi:hypothetical protein